MTVRSDVAASALPPTQATSPRSIRAADREAGPPGRPAASAIRLPLVNDEEFLDGDAPTEYLVDDICTRSALILAHADSGAGKTFLGADFSFSIASGLAWHGHAVARGPVVYVAGEGQPGLRQRIRAWKQHHGLTGKVVGVHIV